MIGLQVEVAGDTPEQRREQKERMALAMAHELQSSAGWEWLVRVLEQRAEILERDLLDVNKVLDQRTEDRFRGEASVYRRIPRLIKEQAAKHKRAAEKAAKEQHHEPAEGSHA